LSNLGNYLSWAHKLDEDETVNQNRGKMVCNYPSVCQFATNKLCITAMAFCVSDNLPQSNAKAIIAKAGDLQIFQDKASLAALLGQKHV